MRGKASAGEESARLAAWIEWRRRCALSRCSPPSVRELRGFAWAQFDRYVRRYAPMPAGRSAHPLSPPAADCWHLLETHLAVDRNSGGKRYKQWLFAYARSAEGSRLAALRTGASLLIRDVVRSYLVREGPQRGSCSFDALEEAGTPAVWGVYDWLPDPALPADEAAEHEFDRLADVYARRFWPDLDDRERVAMAAVEAGLPLSHPSVLRKARCGRSIMYGCYQNAVCRLGERMLADMPREDRSALLVLTRRTLEKLAAMAFAWKNPEKCSPAPFYVGKAKSASCPGPVGVGRAGGGRGRGAI